MKHIFDIEIATKYGINIATFLNNMVFWIQRNVANEKHFYDDKYWTYNSVKSYSILFPYWTPKQIRKIIDDCIKLDLIVKGNYNKTPYDKTSWYAFTDFGLKTVNLVICPKGQTGLPEKANQFEKKGKPIPDTNTDIKTDKSICVSDNSISNFADFWIQYPIKKNRLRCENIWVKNKLNNNSKEIVEKLTLIKQTEWKNIEERFIPNPDSYLRDRRWEDEIKNTKSSKKELKSTVGFWNSDLNLKIKKTDKEIAIKNIKAIKKSLGKK